jgi:hypothetical protein
MTTACPDDPPRMEQVRSADLKAIAGLAGATIVLGCLVFLGQLYRHQCMAAGKDMDQCWDKGLAIAGMGMGGPLSAGVVIGYMIGAVNKEREKQQKYDEGFWTPNPDLHQGNKQ